MELTTTYRGGKMNTNTKVKMDHRDGENPFSQLHVEVIGSLWTKKLFLVESLYLEQIKEQRDCEKHQYFTILILQMMTTEESERGYIIGAHDDGIVVTSDEFREKGNFLSLGDSGLRLCFGDRRLWRSDTRCSGVFLKKSESVVFNCTPGSITTYVENDNGDIAVIISKEDHGISLSDRLIPQMNGIIKTMSFDNDDIIRRDSDKDKEKNLIMITRQA